MMDVRDDEHDALELVPAAYLRPQRRSYQQQSGGER